MWERDSGNQSLSTASASAASCPITAASLWLMKPGSNVSPMSLLTSVLDVTQSHWKSLPNLMVFENDSEWLSKQSSAVTTFQNEAAASSRLAVNQWNVNYNIMKNKSFNFENQRFMRLMGKSLLICGGWTHSNSQTVKTDSQLWTDVCLCLCVWSQVILFLFTHSTRN